MKDLHTWVDIYFRDNDIYQISTGRTFSTVENKLVHGLPLSGRSNNTVENTQKGDNLTLQSKTLKNTISIFVPSDWPYLLLMLHINTHQILLLGKTTDIRRLA